MRNIEHVRQRFNVLRNVFGRQVAKEAEEPKVEDPGPEDSLHDFERFSQAMRVKKVTGEYIEERCKRGRSLQDNINPYNRQTRRGFFLIDYYGSPYGLLTPWGEYLLSGEDGRFTGDKKAFLQRLGATIYRPVVCNEMGTFGPEYAIHKIDNVELPDPVERPGSAYRHYEELDRAWNQLARQYYESLGQTPPLTSIEKFRLDDAILEARGQSEPPVNKDDIGNLEELERFRGKVVKYTMDGGKTWHYTRLDGGERRFSGGLGYGSNKEVMPNRQSHAPFTFTDERFERGMVVRPATEEEIKGLKFSYE